MSLRSGRIVTALLLVAPAALAISAAHSAGAQPIGGVRTQWNLTGTWQGSDGGGGGTYEIRQDGTTVKWFAHSNDGRSWAHDFTGSIQGDDIVGTFQDRPGFGVFQHGSLRLHIVDACHLEFVSASVGFGTQRWTKTGCTVSAKYTFTFSGYGNPQRPFPGYVGPFQLGPTRISGSGTITSTTARGTVTLSARLNTGKYRFPRTRWKIVKLLGASTAGPRTVLVIQVKVLSHSYPVICPAGTLGVLRLIDDERRLQNGYSSDGINTSFPSPSRRAPDGGLACRSHVHGFNNTDVTWSDPPRGGPPTGGNWARVTIRSVHTQ